MDLNKWKQFKRSGGYRRKIATKYAKLMKNAELQSTSNHEASRACEHNTATPTLSTPTNIFEGSVDTKTSEEFSLTSDCESDKESDGENCMESEFEKNIQLRCDLKEWAIKNNIPHSAINELSVILNKRIEHILPKNARTLLKTTSQEINIVELGTGYYWHNGLIKQLKNIMELVIHAPTNLSLSINIDGLPLYNSSRQQFWPILCSISEFPCLPPLVIGIYSGNGKPSDLKAFLDPLVAELNQISSGLTFVAKATGSEMTVPVKVRAFICDSPARALIKGVVNYNGKHGCLKCTVLGEYSHISRTVTFLRYDCPKRNDKDFRSKKDEEHHKLDSPLLKLDIDMVEDIPVCDSLHLIDLGVMKRLLTGWRDGNIGRYLTKWCSRDIEKVNNFLSKCHMPKEIHRSVRKIDVLAHWKGSEYRSFLYYLSFIILKDTLQFQAYYHFLHLFCAITICSNEKHFQFLSIAEKMLQDFVEVFKSLYGKDYVSSNMHNLTHLVDEVRKFGILQSFNAYPFENKLYVIKNLIRQGNKPLQQVARRLNERFDLETERLDNNKPSYPFIKKCQRKGTVDQVCLESFVLSSQEQNKWFLNKENHVIEFKSICTKNKNDANDRDILILGYHIENVYDVFDKPLKSSFLNIYKCSFNDFCRMEVVCKASNVKCKLVAIEHNSDLFFVPLLHTL